MSTVREDAAAEVPDGALLQSIARGSRDAFTTLVRRYERRFYAIARRMLGREADAEDAVQLAFLHVLTRAAGYDASWSGSTWLYRVLANVCIDAWRKRRLDEPPPRRQDGRRHTRGTDDERLDVQAALAKLPAEARVILLCCYVGGLSYGEIARVRGISVNTVKTQLRRAKRSMRRHLEEERS